MPPKKLTKKAAAAAAAAAEEAAEAPVSPKPLKRTKAEDGKDSAPTPKAKPAAKKGGKRAVETQDQPDEAAPVRRQSTAGGPVVTEEMAFAGTTDFVRRTKDSDFDAAAMLRLVSWNVAGLRGFLNKGGDLAKFCADEKPDVLCLQETKLSDWADCPKTGPIPGYSFVDSISTAKKGYSGTRTYIRDGLLSAPAGAVHAFSFDLDKPDAHDDEGRIITTVLPELEELTVVNSYVPNSGMNLERLDYRVENFDPMMRRHLAGLAARRPVIWTGDLNVAERDYDRFWGGNFKQMQKGPGFTPEERASFRKTLADVGLVDAFRALYPTAARLGTYTFFSARFNQRAKGNGWRLDYFAVSAALVPRVVDCFPLTKYTESDHLPLVMWLRRK